jgi:hypothetical protein
MSDESQVAMPVEPSALPATAPSGGKVKAFFSTGLGRVLLIVLAVSTLLTICAVVAVIGLGVAGLSLFQQAVEQGPISVPASGTVGATVPTATVVPGVTVVENSEVFTPRDPFTKILIPLSELTSGATDANTLTLIEIVTDNGVRKAVMTLGSDTYTRAAGERLGDTPWQVVSIGSSSVVMLYGDTKIELTVGQGIVAK